LVSLLLYDRHLTLFGRVLTFALVFEIVNFHVTILFKPER